MDITTAGRQRIMTVISQTTKNVITIPDIKRLGRRTTVITRIPKGVTEITGIKEMIQIQNAAMAIHTQTGIAAIVTGQEHILTVQIKAENQIIAPETKRNNLK